MNPNNIPSESSSSSAASSAALTSTTTDTTTTTGGSHPARPLKRTADHHAQSELESQHPAKRVKEQQSTSDEDVGVDSDMQEDPRKADEQLGDEVMLPVAESSSSDNGGEHPEEVLMNVEAQQAVKYTEDMEDELRYEHKNSLLCKRR